MKHIKKLANCGSHRQFLQDATKEKKNTTKETSQPHAKTKPYIRAHDLLKKVD